MAEITAALVKELRERTGQGMMECKKALVAAGGDIEKAIDDMRASGAIKAAKKAGNIAAEGSIAVRVEGGRGVIIEVNSQTDFLALQDDFKAFVKESIDEAFAQNLTDAAPLIASRESAREALVAKCGENVNIRRLTAVSGETVGAYLHGHRIGRGLRAYVRGERRVLTWLAPKRMPVPAATALLWIVKAPSRKIQELVEHVRYPNLKLG